MVEEDADETVVSVMREVPTDLVEVLVEGEGTEVVEGVGTLVAKVD